MVPHLAGLAVERLSAAPGSVNLLARTCACEAGLHGCGVAAGAQPLPAAASRHGQRLPVRAH
jgi:hypothetical protein